MHAELATRPTADRSQQFPLPSRTTPAEPGAPAARLLGASLIIDEVSQRLARRGIVFEALAEQGRADRRPSPFEMLDIFSQPLFPPAPEADLADLLEAEMMQYYISAISIPRPDTERKSSIILSIFPMRPDETAEAHQARFTASWPSTLR